MWEAPWRGEEVRAPVRFGRSLTPSSKVLGGFWGEKIKSCWRLIVHQSEDMAGRVAGEWNIDQLWFRCRNVLGRHGKVRGAVGTWDSSHGQNSSPRDRRGKGNVLRRGERGLWPRSALLLPAPAATSRACWSEKNRWGHAWLFQPPKTPLNFGELGAGREG